MNTFSILIRTRVPTKLVKTRNLKKNTKRKKLLIQEKLLRTV